MSSTEIAKLTKLCEETIKNPTQDGIDKLKTEINTFKEKQTKNSNSCVMICNTVLKDMSNLVSKNFPDDYTINAYASVMEGIISAKPLEPISVFIKYVYKNNDFRKNILAGNDEFFLADDFNSVVTKEEEDYKSIFIFKSKWKTMADNLKDYIKKSMITLVNTAEKYINAKVNLLDAMDLDKKLNGLNKVT